MTFREQIAQACQEYERTLDYFKQTRRLLECEKMALGRAIQAHGLEALLMALVGAKHEPKTERFDPADWVNLDRYLVTKNFKRFVGLGAKHIQRKQELKRPVVAVPLPESEDALPISEEERQSIARWFPSIVKGIKK